jgi:hypothetical protein
VWARCWAIAPLLEALHRDGLTEVYLTTTTSTGYKLAKEKYGALTIGIGYFPLDFWPLSARAWRCVQPDLCILMEGERWPEHVHQAAVRGRAGAGRECAALGSQLPALDAVRLPVATRCRATSRASCARQSATSSDSGRSGFRRRSFRPPAI